MNRTLLGLALCASMVVSHAACKEDPPPPPPPSPSGSAKGDGKAVPTSRTEVPRISPETMKKYRVETCYFGSLGLLVARDAYLASLKGQPPSPTNVPTLGEYPETRAAKTPKKDEADDKGAGGGRVEGRPPVLAAAGQLPFVRHVRACSIAKSLKDPAYADLDKAILEFDTYANKLNKALLDASRYFQRKQWEKDKFERGKTIHEELTKLFPQLEGELAKLGAAVNAWYPEHTESVEKLDESGTLAHDAIKDARALTLLLMEKERDNAKIGEGIAALEKKRDALVKISTEAKDAVHPKAVAPKLIHFVENVQDVAAIEIAGPLNASHLYPVTAGLANLIEAEQRALAQLLRQRGDTRSGNMPVHAIKPKLGREIPDLKTPKVQVAPPPTADPAE